MFKSQKFVKSVFKLSELPKHRLPEVVLCGRSNVGKSSFINSVFNRKDHAKVSSTPGKTRSINFYDIDGKFYLVDLPGYGYAKTSKQEREYWAKLIGSFLEQSKYTRLAIHFIDSRHEPTKLDIYLNELLCKHKISYLILLSKADKLTQSEKSAAKKKLSQYFPEIDVNTQAFFYSAVKPIGRKEIINLFIETFYHQSHNS